MTSTKKRSKKKAIIRPGQKLSQKVSVANPPNPFELQKSKKKFAVLGHHVKGSQGQPGISRKQGFEERHRVLTSALAKEKKVGQFVDRRLGERDTQLTEEQKYQLRWTKEKQRLSKRALKKSTFQLSELPSLSSSSSLMDEGPSLSFRQPSSSSTSTTLLSKQTNSNDQDLGLPPMDPLFSSTLDTKKSKTEIFQELIQKSKQAKLEKQQSKALTNQWVQEADALFDQLKKEQALHSTSPSNTHASSSFVGSEVKNEDTNEGPLRKRSFRDQDLPTFTSPSVSSDPDPYLALLHQLNLEKRTKPTNRLKTEAEVAMEAKLELEKLEQERIKRMLGEVDEDEDDEKENEDEEDDENLEGMESDEEDEDDDEEEDDDDDDEEEDEEEEMTDESESESEHDFEDESDNIEEPELDQTNKDLSDDDDLVDDFKELEREKKPMTSKDTEKSLNLDDVNLKLEKEKERNKADANASSSSLNKKKESIPSKTPANSSISKKSVETSSLQAQEELPYSFEAPDSLEAFIQLVQGRDLNQLQLFFRRLQVLYHPSFGPEAKTKYNQTLIYAIEFAWTLSYPYSFALPTSSSSCSSSSSSSPTSSAESSTAASAWWSMLYPHLLSLVQSKEGTLLLSHWIHSTMLDLEVWYLHRPWTSLQLQWLELCFRLYSATDFHHVLLSPLTLHMTMYLSQVTDPSIHERYGWGLHHGFFFSSLLLHYLPHRYVPEVYCFLSMALALFVPLPHRTTCLQQLPFLSSTLPVYELDRDALLESKRLPLEWDFIQASDVSSYYPQYASVLLYLVNHWRLAYQSKSLFLELFRPWMQGCLCFWPCVSSSNLTVSTDPTSSSSSSSFFDSYYTQFQTALSPAQLVSKRPLQYHRRQVRSLPTLDPQLDMDTSHTSSLLSSFHAKVTPHQRLVRQVKKAKKDAIRSLKRDSEVVHRLRYEAQQTKLKAYHTKMKSIEGHLAKEVGETRKLEKGIKRK